MFSYSVFIFVIVFLVYPIYSLNNEGDECIQDSPCTCIYPNSLEINLKNLTKDSYISSYGSNSSMYFYSPCQNIAIDSKEPEKKSALWIFVQNGNSSLDPNKVVNHEVNGTFTSIGNSEVAKFMFTAYRANRATVEYDMSGTKSKVELDCVEGIPTEFYAPVPTPGDPSFAYNLRLRGERACARPLTPENHNLSTGSVLVIMFLTFVLIYLLGGMLILKLIRGAEGLELIPNIEFWLWFIQLVKDGINFAFTCRRPNDSYERI